jgi:8-oxo-dGTP pyrophosphatase MutT (NUDIX family)
VAAILRPLASDTEVLLIRRAERPNDPWSGHMAFPGGHQDSADADSRATAMRETLEEVGLDLRGHHYLGELDELSAVARGRRLSMSVTPHVFSIAGDQVPELSPNYEVAELVWGSLGQMYRGALDATKEWRWDEDEDEERQVVPAFNVHGHLVWGMTYFMLRSLFNVLSEVQQVPDSDAAR